MNNPVLMPHIDQIPTTWNYVDFDGPCKQCHTTCDDEWVRMWDRKFGTGFMVEGLQTDPAGGFNEQIIFGKEWPQYSVKANTFDGTSNEYVAIPVAAKVKVGDIRVAYTDHWITDQHYEGSFRTFMKRPEEYWAAKAIPYPPQGSPPDWFTRVDKQRKDWIRCRHSHTDHVHEETIAGGYSPQANYPIAIDDCVTGIWNFNLVDTSTTIETYDIYEAVHLYEVFPACGNLKILSPPDGIVSEPLFHIWADQTSFTEHPEHDHPTCVLNGCGYHAHYDPGNWLHFMKDADCHRQPCGCFSYRGQEGKGIVFATSPWCDHTLARESKNPHRLGIEGAGDYDYRAQLFDNEGQEKIFGAVSETFLQKVGSFYKTTVRRASYGVHQPFQAPQSAEEVMYTFLDPETPGDGPAGHENQGTAGGYWCTRPTDDEDDPDKWDTKMGASYLLTLPCNDPQTCDNFEEGGMDQDGPQCCEDWDDKYCDEQMEHIYFTEADILADFNRDPRLKGSDLEKNDSRDRIHPDTGALALSCRTTVVNGYVWLAEPCAEIGATPRDFWERGLPNDPKANCEPACADCGCGDMPGPPPNTCLRANWNSPTVNAAFGSAPGMKHDTDFLISTLWGVDGVHLGTACSWDQFTPGLFKHCKNIALSSGSVCGGGSSIEASNGSPPVIGDELEAEGYLMAVGFYQGKLNEEGQIDFEVVKRLKLHLPKVALAGGWGTGLSGGNPIQTFTDYDTRCPELPNNQFGQEGTRFVTDFEAAEVFTKAGAGNTKYWYDLVAKKGQQLNFMGELDGNPANVGYLSTGPMNPQDQDPKRCVGEPPASRCGNPELVAAAGLGYGIKMNPCRLEYEVPGCGPFDEDTGSYTNTSIKIFTGHGDPAPRFDEDQRVKTIEAPTSIPDETTTECVQYVDEYFMLSEKFVECIREAGILRPDGSPPVPELDNCDALIYGHKPYIKLKDELKETGFFTCGLPVGNVDRDFPLIAGETGPVVGLEGDPLWDFCYCEDDCGAITDIYPVIDIITMQRDFSYTNKVLCEMPKDVPDDKGNYGYGGVWKCDNFGAPELDLCGTTWHDLEEYGRKDSPNKYCGLVPDSGDSEGDDTHRVVSCTACENFECQTGKPFDSSYDQPPYYVSCAGGVGGDEGNGVHCCSFLVPNPYYNPLVDSVNTPFPHPRIIGASSCLETQEYCDAYGYLGGMPHVPYEKGYIWHSVLGWHPDSAASGDENEVEHRYSCEEGKADFVNNIDNMAFDCCAGGESLELNSCWIPDPLPKVYGYPKVTVADAPIPSVYLL